MERIGVREAQVLFKVLGKYKFAIRIERVSLLAQNLTGEE